MTLPNGVEYLVGDQHPRDIFEIGDWLIYKYTAADGLRGFEVGHKDDDRHIRQCLYICRGHPPQLERVAWGDPVWCEWRVSGDSKYVDVIEAVIMTVLMGEYDVDTLWAMLGLEK